MGKLPLLLGQDRLVVLPELLQLLVLNNYGLEVSDAVLFGLQDLHLRLCLLALHLLECILIEPLLEPVPEQLALVYLLHLLAELLQVRLVLLE